MNNFENGDSAQPASYVFAGLWKLLFFRTERSVFIPAEAFNLPQEKDAGENGSLIHGS